MHRIRVKPYRIVHNRAYSWYVERDLGHVAIRVGRFYASWDFKKRPRAVQR